MKKGKNIHALHHVNGSFEIRKLEEIVCKKGESMNKDIRTLKCSGSLRAVSQKKI